MHCAGQAGYGYVSFERFVRAAAEINAGRAAPEDFDAELPTGRVTETVTAILEAGRLSLGKYTQVNTHSQLPPDI